MSFRHSTIIFVIFLGWTISSGNIPSALGGLPPPDIDLLEQVPIELVQMELTGFSPLGPVNLGLNPARPSLGEIEENANTEQDRLDLPPFAPDGTANSFFDVFFELDLPALGLQLHNEQPARVQTIIDHKPPTPGTRYCGEVGVLLVDQQGNPVVRILNVCHIID